MADIDVKASEEVSKILSSCTVDDVVFDRPVVFLTASSTVPEALNVLTDNRILSVPVYDEEAKKFIGFVDYNDVMDLIVECYKTRPASGKHVFQDIAEFLKDMAADPMHPFKSIVNLSRRNPYHSVPPGTTLLQVAQLLGQEGLHRIPVEKDGTIIKIISQSHIVGVLATNLRLFSHVLLGSVKDAGLLKEVVSVSASTKILDALEQIAQSGISGVAVVDPENGKMVANLSSSDIRVLLATEDAHYDFFSLSALQVVQVSRRMMPHHPTPDDAKSFPAVVTAHPDTPFAELIERLAATRLHRMYIVDAEGHAVGVVSLKDILSYWIRQPKTLATFSSAQK